MANFAVTKLNYLDISANTKIQIISSTSETWIFSFNAKLPKIALYKLVMLRKIHAIPELGDEVANVYVTCASIVKTARAP